MTAHRAPYGLEQFFGGYFHQDWPLEADDWQEVVDQYSASPDRTSQQLHALAAQVDELLRSFPASELATAIMDMGGFYDPRPDMTYSEWLGHVAERLRQHAADIENDSAD
ncbi:contact-dependent growth inhibition system immunity protein [Mycolicibacterium confluentis]|uniref:Uncharacterized protein n=1 Tax=Mycolicibacterium confluentis TaxID=28047 RepID=A0A7I7XZX9_9MYCO|nr:contact-dependent growth inhibition system immunity protein [Mycolicibacterium confluentis]MCV7319473.1 hypothetical protein [Mycolicibacterium confluentis]ORV34107.1 hypothetical protein AWB99_00140 [Mycolicibacterium confluentis]BBZ34493.1 hypothetical protein MCNF_30980 [Mycolicibacterium confluentis]